MVDLSFVEKTIFQSSNSLKEIVKSTGLDVYSFFQGAELTGLDLSGQDLKGLNFNNAILKGANLDGVEYHEGAFNKAILDEKYENKKDKFRLDIADAVKILEFVHIPGYFRRGYIDLIKKEFGVTYGYLAKLSNISQSTLRSARNGNFISAYTFGSICIGIWDLISPRISDFTHLIVPSICVPRWTQYSGHDYYTVDTILQILDFARIRKEVFSEYSEERSYHHSFLHSIDHDFHMYLGSNYPDPYEFYRTRFKHISEIDFNSVELELISEDRLVFEGRYSPN